MEIITSESNSLIKEIKKLSVAKNIKKERYAVIEGLRIVEDAISCGMEISKIVVSEKFDFEVDGIAKYVISDKLFKDIADTKNPQGILAIVKIPEWNFDDIVKSDNPFIVVADGIQDPGNLGTIIRTADAAGCSAIILSKGTVNPYTAKVLRSTMGSVFRLPVIQSEDIVRDIKKLKDNNIQTIATDLKANCDIFNTEYSDRVAIVIGNEANGISKELLENIDLKVKIPMIGKAESLNAAVAAGIAIYQIVKERIS